LIHKTIFFCQLSLLYFSNKPLFRFDRFNHFGLILQELKRERNTKDAETKRREKLPPDLAQLELETKKRKIQISVRSDYDG